MPLRGSRPHHKALLSQEEERHRAQSGRAVQGRPRWAGAARVKPAQPTGNHELRQRPYLKETVEPGLRRKALRQEERGRQALDESELVAALAQEPLEVATGELARRPQRADEVSRRSCNRAAKAGVEEAGRARS